MLSRPRASAMMSLLTLAETVLLQASTERSRRLYLRHGFRDIETWHGAFPVFLMWRPAGSMSAAAAACADGGQSAAIDRVGNSAASQQRDPAADIQQTHAERLVESTDRTHD